MPAAAKAPATDVLVRQQVFVQRLATGEAEKFRVVLREWDAILRAQLFEGNLTNFSRQRLEQQLATIDQLLAGPLDTFSKQLVLNLQDFAQHEAGVTAKAIAQTDVTRVLYRGTTGSTEKIVGGIGEGHLFAAADEATAKLYGSNVEQIGVRSGARILVEGTAEFAKVTGRRRGKLLDTMRAGENLKTAADDAVRLAKAAGYDAVEFTSFKDLGIAIFNESAVVRNYGAAPAQGAKTTLDALALSMDFESTIPAVTQLRAAVLSDPLGALGADGGKVLQSFITDWTVAERKAVTGAIRLGVFEGQTNAKIIQRLRGTRARGYKDGLLDVTRRHAEAVVRTAVQHVSTVARRETFKVNADVVKKVRWLSTLDKRTCPRCGALDGREFAIKVGPRPPLHPNCRCTTVPVLSGEFAFLDEGMKRPFKGPNGGGQTDAGESYYAWLMRQPAAFQDEAIGPSRARLLRSGGLSAARFAAMNVDKQFAPLTLEAMKRLEPLAFQRAGL